MPPNRPDLMARPIDERVFKADVLVDRRRVAGRWFRRALSARTLEGTVVLTPSRIEFRRATRFDRLLLGLRPLGKQHVVELTSLDEFGYASEGPGWYRLIACGNDYTICFRKDRWVWWGGCDAEGARQFHEALSALVTPAPPSADEEPQ